MTTVYIDFETRSRIDIKRCGAGKYARDPSTEILMTGYAINDGPVKVHYGSTIPWEIKKATADLGVIFCAQNAFFEYFIWMNKWNIPVPEFKCTRAKLGAHGLPQKLELGARALKLGVEKDIEGRRLIGKFSVPRPDGTFYNLDDFPEEKKRFMGYCGQDITVERLIDKRLPDLTPFEQELFNLTMQMNARGITIDRTLATIADDIGQKLVKHCNDRLRQLTDDKFYSIGQTVRLKEYLNKTYGLALPDMSGDTIDEHLNSVKDPVAREILVLRTEFGRTSISKFGKMNEAVCDDDRIRDYVIYHGAHTGRWTSQLVQLHNLPRGGDINPNHAIDILKQGDSDFFERMYEFPISTLSSCIRGALLPAKGKKLFVADYNAIEARVLMWLADQKDAVQMFRDGEDIYLDMARSIYHDPGLTKANKQERQLGKQVILGCGFQMGAPKFKVTCAGYGIDIDEEVAKTAVYGYRNKYTRVVQYWEDVERAAMAAVRTGKAFRIGHVVFFMQRGFLKCRLPSGRDLAYYAPKIEERDTKVGRKHQLGYHALNSQTNVFGPVWTYGGKLTENIVQAVARDIMATAKLKLEKESFEILLSTHDEIIAQATPHGFMITDYDVEDSLERMIRIMCTLPDWADGCPITAEGWVGDRYRK